jgi:two-component system, NtrC family, sensor kinase
MDHLVVKRLTRLAGAMDNYPQHPLDPGDLPVDRDEIGELSRNFSALGDRLEKSQNELARTREKMFHNEKMAAIGQLAAGIAHEVNNPLGGMRNCVKSLREDPDDREMRERYLELLDKGLMRIGHIVRQLLNFGRETPITPQETDIAALIRACFELLSFHLKNIDLQLDLAINSSYRLDGEVLKQALINIGLNAVQAMPEGGTLKVTGREEPEWLILTIADNGPGIPPDNLGRIFEPFFTTKEPGAGTGLGLSVSFSLIKRMGGHIEVESRPGEGSTFTIKLPRREMPA